MKKIIITAMILILSSTSLGFDYIKNAQDTFGFVRTHYTLKNKKCKDCNFSLDIKKEKVNEAFLELTFIKASSFVVGYKNNRTHIMTSNHVCTSIKEFEVFDKSKDGQAAKDMLKSSFESDLLFSLAYAVKPTVSITDFKGNMFLDAVIEKTQPKDDLCIISVKGKIGKPVVFENKPCRYTEVYNISASGGFYSPNAVPLLSGFANNIIPEVKVQNYKFKNVLMYSMPILPGGSGSAVFNKQGKVCGNINFAMSKPGISYGAPAKVIQDFYLQFYKTL